MEVNNKHPMVLCYYITETFSVCVKKVNVLVRIHEGTITANAPKVITSTGISQLHGLQLHGFVSD
jgi:hypothetical protein